MKLLLFSAMSGLLLAPSPASGQSGPAVIIQQIPRGMPSRASSISPATPPIESSASVDAPPEALPESVPMRIIEACRRTELGAPAPEGVDCVALLERVAASQLSAEGSLLGMLGASTSVTQPTVTRVVDSSDPDGVARQLSSGDVQGVAGSEAGAIASRQRSAPPSGSPR